VSKTAFLTNGTFDKEPDAEYYNTLSTWVIREIAPRLKKNKVVCPPETFGYFVRMAHEGIITNRIARDFIEVATKNIEDQNDQNKD